MNTKNVLKRNESMIQKEVARLEAIIDIFQPVLNEIYATGFEFTTAEFQNICYSTKESLIVWLKKNTIAKNPAVNNLGITEEAKLRDIQLADYFALYSAFDKLPINRVVRGAVYSFTIDDNKLKLSDTAMQRIYDDYTIYGNDTETDAFDQLNKIKTSIDLFASKFGFNPLAGNSCLIRVNFSGETIVNTENITHLMRTFNK